MEFLVLGVNFEQNFSENSRKFVNFWLKGVNFTENLGKNSRNLNLNSQNLRVKFWRVFGVNFLQISQILNLNSHFLRVNFLQIFAQNSAQILGQNSLNLSCEKISRNPQNVVA